ncbi:antitoxin of toxin-antitoxin stability system [Escherichia coli]|nr:antitoxin of toxin-antitoxin stability system [Escherichia coli]
MSRIITTTVYTLNELSSTAQEKARDGYRQHHADSNWYENVYEDFRAVCDIFGIDLRQRVFRLSNGRFMEEPCIWFSGFCSQGDGACFEGRWHWQSATARRVGVYAPQDRELHRIADALQAVQKRNFWQLQAEIHHRGRYCHPYCMDITVTRNSPTGQAMTTDAEAAVSEALRDLAFWLYRQLENEYDWLTSDAAVDEALLINEYTFTEAGLRAGCPVIVKLSFTDFL